MEIHTYSSFGDVQRDWIQAQKDSFYYPFQSFWYNKVFYEHFSKNDQIFILGVYDNKQLLALGSFEIVNNVVTFLGTKDVSKNAGLVQDITDVGDLLYTEKGKEKAAEIWKELEKFFIQKGFTNFKLSYVRQDSPTYTALSQMTEPKQQEVSPFVTLPSSWDEYLASLDKKKRHELKRKIKRLENLTSFTTCTQETVHENFTEFVRLHKLSDTNKAIFMTPDMEAFFQSLLSAEKTDWHMHFYSLFIEKKEVATLLAFSNKSHVLLYNSGFDPEYAFYSVGLLVSAFLIKQAITDGKKIVDFLRGNERYKYDLGAKDMPLFELTFSSRS